MARIFGDASIPEFPFSPERMAEDIFTVINYEKLMAEGCCIKEDKGFYEDRILRELTKRFDGMRTEEIIAIVVSLR